MTPDSWTQLKQFTTARIALGRSGASVPTRSRLEFLLAVARARDAVMVPFNPADLTAQLAGLSLPVIVLTTKASDRATYLRRPDLGRQLCERSRADLEKLRMKVPWDLAIVISDGLSSLAAVRQPRLVIEVLLPKLLTAGWRVAPLVVAANARVALQDEVGGILGAMMSLMLLGERPGLGSTDSLGAYFTLHPSPGKTDADRNCLSNICPQGLKPEMAAQKLFDMLVQSRQRQLSGVELKDELDEFKLALPPANHIFL